MPEIFLNETIWNCWYIHSTPFIRNYVVGFLACPDTPAAISTHTCTTMKPHSKALYSCISHVLWANVCAFDIRYVRIYALYNATNMHALYNHPCLLKHWSQDKVAAISFPDEISSFRGWWKHSLIYTQQCQLYYMDRTYHASATLPEYFLY